MIHALTDEGARLLAADEAGRLQPPAGTSPGDYWWILAGSHSEVAIRRITLPGRTR